MRADNIKEPTLIVSIMNGLDTAPHLKIACIPPLSTWDGASLDQ